MEILCRCLRAFFIALKRGEGVDIVISELQKEQTVIGFFAVKEIMEKETRETRKKYLDLTLLDGSGQINGKVWDIADVIQGEIPGVGDIVKVDALVQEYRGSLQLKVNKLRKATDADSYEKQKIIPAAPAPAEQMLETILRFAEEIADQPLRAACLHIIHKYKGQIMTHPAAKTRHHSYKSGWLQHVTTMLLVAEKLTTIYSCNKDLLYAGIIFHDIGKLQELKSDQLCVGIEYSTVGELLGHISLGLAEMETVPNLDSQRKHLLQHMILSHHENPEWGSPIKPMFKEAELLHLLDLMDARMFDFEKCTKSLEKGALSGKVYELDRKIYNPLI